MVVGKYSIPIYFDD